MAVAASLHSAHESTLSKRGSAHFVAGKKVVSENKPKVINQERVVPREAALAVVASSQSSAHPASSSPAATSAAGKATFTPSTSFDLAAPTGKSAPTHSTLPISYAGSAQAAGAVVQNEQSSVVDAPPSSVKALAGAIVVLGLAIIGIIGYKLYRRQQRKKQASNPMYQHQVNKSEEGLDIFGYSVEKPAESYNPFPPVPATPAGVKWVPQIASHLKMPENSKRSKKAKRAWEKNLGKLMSDNCSPAQPYDLRGSLISKPIMPPSPPETFWQAPGAVPMPPTPIKNNKTPTENTLPTFNIVPAPGQSSPASPHTPQSVPPTPRSASFSATISGSLSRQSNTGLPRPMKVTTTFEPTQADELAIVIGETVELLEEFADEWCLVRRAGERGVIPRFCISEMRL